MRAVDGSTPKHELTMKHLGTQKKHTYPSQPRTALRSQSQGPGRLQCLKEFIGLEESTQSQSIECANGDQHRQNIFRPLPGNFAVELPIIWWWLWRDEALGLARVYSFYRSRHGGWFRDKVKRMGARIWVLQHVSITVFRVLEKVELHRGTQPVKGLALPRHLRGDVKFGRHP